MCWEESSFPVMYAGSVYGLIKKTTFYYIEERFFIVGLNYLFIQILIISKNKFRKAVLYYSNFVKKITECNQKFWTFHFR